MWQLERILVRAAVSLIAIEIVFLTAVHHLGALVAIIGLVVMLRLASPRRL